MSKIFDAVSRRVNVSVFYQRRCRWRYAKPSTVARDPFLIRNKGTGHPAQIGYWPRGEREKMDERFAAAMTRAGYVVTAPSTCPGTRAPILGDPRPD